MFRTFLVTTAAMTLMSGFALAQTATTPAPPATETTEPMQVTTRDIFTGAGGAAAANEMAGMTKISEGQLLASGIIGKNVYNGDGADAESIGKLNDLILGQDGMVQAAVVGVGGFLGVGQKNVALPANQLKLSVREDKSSWIVIETTKDKLNAAPAFETSENFTEGVADPSKANEADADAQPAAPETPAPADTTTPAAPAPAAPAN